MSGEEQGIETQFERGMAAHREGESEAAREYYQQVLESDPAHANCLHMLGVLCAQERDNEQAREFIAKAIAVMPDVPQMHNHLGNVLRALGELDSAVQSYERALELAPDFGEVLNNLGNVSFAKADYSRAKSFYEAAIAADPNLFDAHYNLGNLLLDEGKVDASRKALEMAHELCPDHPKIECLLARTYADDGDLVGAMALLDKTIEQFPTYTNARQLQAVYALTAGETGKARRHYEALLSMTPYDPDVSYNLAVIAEAEDRMDEALNYYLATLRIDSESVESHINIANCYLRIDEEDNAVSHLQAAAMLDPDHKAVRYRLAALTGKATAQRAPEDYVENLFDHYAKSYEDNMRDDLDYQVPEIFMQILDEQVQAARYGRVLDLGCGTGLCGYAVKPYSDSLTGVDLSSGMLMLAEQRVEYDDLVQMDIEQYCATCDRQYDLIIAGDVFNYLGDLQPILHAMKTLLTRDGVILFSTEKGTDTFALEKNARFKHATDYVHKCIQKAKLKCRFDSEVTLRTQRGEDVRGNCYLLSH